MEYIIPGENRVESATLKGKGKALLDVMKPFCFFQPSYIEHFVNYIRSDENLEVEISNALILTNPPNDTRSSQNLDNFEQDYLSMV